MRRRGPAVQIVDATSPKPTRMILIFGTRSARTVAPYGPRFRGNDEKLPAGLARVAGLADLLLQAPQRRGAVALPDEVDELGDERPVRARLVLHRRGVELRREVDRGLAVALRI